MSNDDGGHAFPDNLNYGMTLWDYFVAHAPKAPIPILDKLPTPPREFMSAQAFCDASYAEPDGKARGGQYAGPSAARGFGTPRERGRAEPGRREDRRSGDGRGVREDSGVPEDDAG